MRQASTSSSFKVAGLPASPLYSSSKSMNRSNCFAGQVRIHGTEEAPRTGLFLGLLGRNQHQDAVSGQGHDDTVAGLEQPFKVLGRITYEQR